MLHRQWGKEKSPNCPFCHFPPPLNFFPHQESAFSLDCVLQTLGKALKGTFDPAHKENKKNKHPGAGPSVDGSFRHGKHSHQKNKKKIRRLAKR